MKPTLENADYFLGVLAGSYKNAEIVLDFNKIVNEARNHIEELEERIKNLREALKWYADPKRPWDHTVASYVLEKDEV